MRAIARSTIRYHGVAGCGAVRGGDMPELSVRYGRPRSRVAVGENRALVLDKVFDFPERRRLTAPADRHLRSRRLASGALRDGQQDDGVRHIVAPNGRSGPGFLPELIAWRLSPSRSWVTAGCCSAVALRSVI